MRDEDHYKVLDLVARNPEATQRQLANELNVSLGKINYCLSALIEKGHIKVRNFTNSNHKAAYAYLLTPRGLKEKAKVTLRFLERKKQEYEQLKIEIEQLDQEVKRQDCKYIK